MYEKEVLLSSECGIKSIPKNDGRVEVPQSIIKLLGWQKKGFAFISNRPGELLLYNKKPKSFLNKISISGGRIRIPVTILRTTGFDKKTLSFFLGNNCVIARANDGHNTNKLGDFNTKELSSILLNKEIVREPALFFIGYVPIVFRPIRPPFRFTGVVSSSGELVITEPNKKPGLTYFLLPIIKHLGISHKERFDYGYLLTTEEHMGSIIKGVKNSNIQNFNKSLIIHLKNIFSNLWVGMNPPDELPGDIIINAKKVCNNTEDFLRNSFKHISEINGDLKVTFPCLLSNEVIYKFNKDIRIG